jgi:hypothetical protein
MAEHGIGIVTLNGDVPKFMKLIMLFIDRVGFPTMAFFLMFYMAHVGMEKQNKALNEVTKALVENSMAMGEFKVSTTDFRFTVLRDHVKLQNDIEEIKKYSYGYNDYKSGKIK